MHFYQTRLLLAHPAFLWTVGITVIFLFLVWGVTALLNLHWKKQPFRNPPGDFTLMLLQQRNDTRTQVGYQQTPEGQIKQKQQTYYSPNSHLISFSEDDYHQNSYYSANIALQTAYSAKKNRKYPASYRRILQICALTGSSLFTFGLIIDGILSMSQKSGFLQFLLISGGILLLISAGIALLLSVILNITCPAEDSQNVLQANGKISDEENDNLRYAGITDYWTITGNLFPDSLGILTLLWLLIRYLVKTRRI